MEIGNRKEKGKEEEKVMDGKEGIPGQNLIYACETENRYKGGLRWKHGFTESASWPGVTNDMEEER